MKLVLTPSDFPFLPCGALPEYNTFRTIQISKWAVKNIYLILFIFLNPLLFILHCGESSLTIKLNMKMKQAGGEEVGIRRVREFLQGRCSWQPLFDLSPCLLC